ncbi:MAG: right-handed parallel beta-helix repeat-containing protein [Verrucomicrobia subdivision 3 bacterium]|nr:right-handed parallel beta-helix repeat-containing protein [Limisphaerales bacterium]
MKIWPAPKAERVCEDYSLRVNGQPVSVYSCRVSAVPLNQVWPGYQRPLDQTELAGFAHWEMARPVKVEVIAKRPFKNVVVRPGSRAIHPTVRGQRITFTLAKPGQVTVELDGPHHALHLFADPPEIDAPEPDRAGVRYFGPGSHRPGKIQLKSDETLYVAGGAVVYTAIEARGATNVSILGRGVIDTSEYERDQGGGCIRLTDCSNVKIDGVILRDPDVWCLSAFGCRNLEIANVKLIGLWRYNADGIDLCNSQEVVVRNSFVRAFDDAIVLKGIKGLDQRPVRNVRVHDNVIWCDWGRGLEIGAETAAPEFADIQFRDCDIIRTTHIAMDIQCGDRAVVHDVRYENIRVETDDVCPSPKMQGSREERYAENPNDDYVPNLMVIVIAKNPYSQDTERGKVRDITYQNITVTGRRTHRSYFMGLDAEHTVQGVAINNLRFNGQPAKNATEAHLALEAHVSDVRFGK